MSEKQQWAQLKFGILHSVIYPFYPEKDNNWNTKWNGTGLLEMVSK